MRGKTAYQAYEKGSRYGKFNSLYGTGDHPKEGGKIVEGVSGKIHIMGGSDDGKFSRVEGDIMKANPKEGEYILAQRNGYRSLDEVPVDETTGYRKYSWLSKKLGFVKAKKTKKSVFDIFDVFTADWWDKKVSDPLQQKFNIGEYSDEAKRNVELEKMLGSQIGSAITGQEEMEGFIGQQLAEQMTQFGIKKDMLSTASEKLGTQTTGVQQSMGQYAGARDIQKQTGLITDTSPSLEAMETQGKMQMANIGASRKDISSQRQLIGSQERGAETQAEIDIAQGKQRTQQALASMLSDYMTATGETIDQSFLDMFTDYQEGTFESVEDYT